MDSRITVFPRKHQVKIADKPEKEFTPLAQRVQSMAFITERLLETLAELCNNELKEFNDIIFRKSHRYDPYSHIPDRVLQMAELLQSVFFVVQTQGRESLAKATSALLLLGRKDLAQRLSDCSGEPKDKHLDEHQSGLSHKMATMVAVEELLLEILEDFQGWDLKKFRWFLQLTYFEKGLPHISFNEPESSGTKGAVVLMMKTCGQQCVEVTREVFRDMNRTDLVQKLLASSSEHKEKQSVDERWPALIQKQVESMASVTELLLETLADLIYNDFEYFKLLLSQIHCHKPDSVIPWSLFRKADLQDAVLSVVQTYGQQAVEKTVEFLKEMNKTDLAQKLSDRSSKPQKKLSVNEGRSPLIQKVATMAAVKQLLLEALNDLGNEDIKKFEKALTSLVPQKNCSFISWRLHESSDRADIVEVLVNELGQKSVEVARKLFMDMKGTDLVQKWSETSSEKLSVDEDEAAALKRVWEQWFRGCTSGLLNEVGEMYWIYPCAKISSDYWTDHINLL